MRLELAGKVVEIETKGDENATDLVKAIAEHEAMDGILDAVVADMGWERWELWDSIEDSTIRTIAVAFLEGGRDAASDAIFELVQDSGENEAEGYVENVAKSYGLLKQLLSAVTDAVLEVDEDAYEDGISGEFLDEIREALAEKMVDADESSPLAAIPSHARVEMIEILAPAGADVHEDECLIEHVGVVGEVGTVVPGVGLKGMFERLNVSFAGFVDHVAEKQGVRLDAGRHDEKLVSYLVDADYVGDRGYARERALERADAWASFDPAYDAGRPSVSTFDDVATMIDNAGYGGHAVHVFRLPLVQLLDRDWSVPSATRADGTYGDRGGGFVGIFNHSNGSGYLEMPRASVQIPAGTDRMRVSGSWGYSVDDVFGMVGTCYYAVAEDDANPVPVVENDAAPAL